MGFLRFLTRKHPVYSFGVSRVPHLVKYIKKNKKKSDFSIRIVCAKKSVTFFSSFYPEIFSTPFKSLTWSSPCVLVYAGIPGVTTISHLDQTCSYIMCNLKLLRPNVNISEFFYRVADLDVKCLYAAKNVYMSKHLKKIKLLF